MSAKPSLRKRHHGDSWINAPRVYRRNGALHFTAIGEGGAVGFGPLQVVGFRISVRPSMKSGNGQSPSACNNAGPQLEPL
jgi:hypothetical protein